MKEINEKKPKNQKALTVKDLNKIRGGASGEEGSVRWSEDGTTRKIWNDI